MTSKTSSPKPVVPALNEEAESRQAELWREENQEAIAAYNAMITEHGLFADYERVKKVD